MALGVVVDFSRTPSDADSGRDTDRHVLELSELDVSDIAVSAAIALRECADDAGVRHCVCVFPRTNGIVRALCSPAGDVERVVFFSR